MRFGSYINFLTTVVTCALAAKKNLIVDTDLFSDVEYVTQSEHNSGTP
jgi:hypothetical protein